LYIAIFLLAYIQWIFTYPERPGSLIRPLSTNDEMRPYPYHPITPLNPTQ